MTASACEVGVAFGDFRTDDISASSLGGKEGRGQFGCAPPAYIYLKEKESRVK